MTAESDGATPDNTATSAGPSAQPSLDVVDAALKQMFADVADGSTDALADLAAVDSLVTDAMEACRHARPDTMVSLIAAISDRHGRDGVSHAISVLCGLAEHHHRHQGQSDHEVEFTATLHRDLSGDQSAILVRSARLASDLLSATLTHDGPRLAEALHSISTETFDPVLSILISHAAGALTSTDDARAHISSTPDRRLCPTTQA